MRGARARLKMVFLTRTDTSRNINRFYVVSVTETLFGEWAVMREWGRRGQAGTVRLDSYERRDDAQLAERHVITRRIAHGIRRSEKAAC